MKTHIFAFLIVLSLISGITAAVSSTGFTVLLDDTSYFLPPAPVATIPVPLELALTFSSGPFVPLTVVSTTTKGFNSADVSSMTAEYLKSDDVFQEGFQEALYIQYTGNQTLNAPEISSGNFSNIVLTNAVPGSPAPLPPGPYFVNTVGQIYEAWRLYSDTNGAFTESVIANPAGEFYVLPAGIVGQNLALAVPSRLYFTPTEEKPLAGVRIGIKDIYDIKGLRTSNGNRAWYWLYPPANTTATPVQKLIDAGAVIVGKMVTSQFANGERATADWVDYHEAFNPRGDGYQDTQTSSSGGGAATGAYPWLDVSLGSDTGGSVRGPAQAQGIYGNRPSHGILSLEHTMPLSPVLDTPGLLARDPLIWATTAKAMYGTNLTLSTAYPKSILTSTWPTSVDTVANTLLIDFLANVTAFLSANTTAYNVSATWISDNPSSAPLETLLNITYPILISQQQIPLVRDPFYTDFAAAHSGRRPFVDPVSLVRWAWGEDSSATVEEAVANKTAFMTWFNTTVLVPDA
ncbi:amidase signature domain-containing protein, partial [Clohesyomyces aquaticus]